MMVTLSKDHLSVEIDNHTHLFHYVWLRHNCSCIGTEDGCRHIKTKERIINLTKIPFDISVENHEVDGDTLKIQWTGGHKSEYAREWLVKWSYWTTIRETRPEDVIVNFKDRSPKLLHHILATYGMVVVKGGSAEPDATLKLADEFGGKIIETHFGLIEDLMPNNTTNKNNDQLGYTFSAVELHTDQPFIKNPPGMQMLHCIKKASKGGENVIANVKLACQILRQDFPEDFKILTTKSVHFHRVQEKFESLIVSPLLQVDENGELIQIRYSYFTMDPFHLSPNEMIPFYKAYKRFSDIINDPKYNYLIGLEPGDYVLYNNHTCCHARTAFEGDRHMRGVYFDTKNVMSHLSDPKTSFK
jgi:alpha-ketoglutarate-dependent taurine dioxygenase